jgi:hypothetical protein
VLPLHGKRFENLILFQHNLGWSGILSYTSHRI